MVSPGIEEKVAFLSQPLAYPNGVRSVKTKQTHMSWVFLTPMHAWKLKKPVRYAHLDFSTLQPDETIANRKCCSIVDWPLMSTWELCH